MIRKFFALAAFAALMTLGSTADASILFGNPELSSNTGVSEIRDDSAGMFVNKVGSADTLDVGDIIRGIIKFANVDGTAFSGGDVYAVYAFQVVAADADRIQLGNVSSDADSALAWLTGSGATLNDATVDIGGPTTAKDHSVIVLESATTLQFSNVNSSLKKISDGTAAFSGFDVIVKAGVDPFYGGGHEIISTSSLDLTDLSAATGFKAAPPNTKNLARYEAGYKVNAIGHPLGHSLADVAYLGNPFATDPGTGYVGEISVYDGGIHRATSAQITAGWDFADDGTFLMNPVPEPATIAIWAALGLGGAGFVARRRMKNAKKA